MGEVKVESNREESLGHRSLMNEGESEESKQSQMIEEGGERAGNRRDPKDDGSGLKLLRLRKKMVKVPDDVIDISKDDQLLISAWLKISKDVPMVGNEEKVDSFWNRMAEYFNKHREDGGARTSNQLRQHWHKLNRAVMPFVGFYGQVSQGRQGRMSEDIINRSHQLYEEEIGKKFLLEHAWRLLKDEPKWKACHDTSGNSCSSCKRMKVSESGVYSSSSTPDTPGDVGVSEECEVQPIDGKAVKKKVKEKLREESESDFQARFEKLKSLEKERNSAIMHFSWVKEKEIGLKQEEVEIKILLADTASMSPLRREIHEKMLKEILKKYK